MTIRSRPSTDRWRQTTRPSATRRSGSEAGQGPAAESATSTLLTELGSLRGVTAAAADVSECCCPEACERDHANE